MAAPRLLLAFLMTLPPLSAQAEAKRASFSRSPLAPRSMTKHNPRGYDSHYAPVPRSTEASSCARTELPQALSTPDPLLGADNASFSVSFLIGPDGRVHSAFILESSNASANRSVLKAVEAWRYRPASCNGVPMEAEGRIEFLSH